jgi:hypothetical protein
VTLVLVLELVLVLLLLLGLGLVLVVVISIGISIDIVLSISIGIIIVISISIGSIVRVVRSLVRFVFASYSNQVISHYYIYYNYSSLSIEPLTFTFQRTFIQNLVYVS